MHKYQKPTKAEAERMDAMMKLGCVACAAISIAHPAEECHHLLSGNKRMGHWYTIPLCKGHHRSYWSALQAEIMDPDKCVSIADGRKAFTKVYPTEKVLWERVQDRLHLPKEWPVSKILPRRVA